MKIEEFMKVYACLSHIKALCEAPYWTAGRKAEIIMHVNEATKVLNAAEKRVETTTTNQERTS